MHGWLINGIWGRWYSGVGSHVMGKWVVRLEPQRLCDHVGTKQDLFGAKTDKRDG